MKNVLKIMFLFICIITFAVAAHLAVLRLGLWILGV